MVDWAQVGLAVGGSISGAYLGVKISVTRLQTEMLMVRDEIKSLRESRHEHGNKLQAVEARLYFLERRNE